MNIDEFISYLCREVKVGGEIKQVENPMEQIRKIYVEIGEGILNVANLEHAGYFENFLWPNFNSESNQSADSKEIVFSMIKLINFKIIQKVNVWDFFRTTTTEEKKFQGLFEKVTNFSLKDLTSDERFVMISFLVNCFQNIEENYLNSICSKLVNLPIWLRLSQSTLKVILLQHHKLIKNWKKISQFAKEVYSSKPCYFIHNLIDTFLEILEGDVEIKSSTNLNFYNKFVEFIIDLLSQLNYRKFLLPVIREKHFIERCFISKINTKDLKEGKLFFKQLEIIQFYKTFEIDEENGESLTPISLLKQHYENINLMQSIAYDLFPDKLSRIYLKNISLIDNRQHIIQMLDLLNLSEVYTFAKNLKLLSYNEEFYSKELLYEIFCSHFERKLSVLEKVNNLSLYPTEKLIWDNELIPNEYQKEDRVLAIPKLNLQFLSHYDYLLRNFNLFRLESTFETRQDLDEILEMVHPKFDKKGVFVEFEGWAKKAVPIRNFRILTVKSKEIGKDYPSEVIAEIEVNLQGVQSQLRTEWDSIKRHDILFCIFFGKEGDYHTDKGVRNVRGCEVLSVFDQQNNEFSEVEGLGSEINKRKPLGSIRKIQVWLDPLQYKQDLSNKDMYIEEVYSNFQLLVRKNPKESNFKSILETIRDLMNSITIIPKWLEKIFLGYGEPAAAHYTKLNDLTLFSKQVDMKDTFIDDGHFKECVTNNENLDKTIRTMMTKPKALSNTIDTLFSFNLASINLIKDIHKQPSLYQSEQGHQSDNISKLKKNKIRFTKNQVEAIVSGLNPGLSVIVGPPGTGKTDVAVQIISLITHNYPDQRTLIVTHSNQALNDLFEKITKLDINERYLLRLGMGEKDLDLDNNFSTHGRVNYMLKRRLDLLHEILLLSHSLDDFSHLEYTCETSINFYEFQIKSRYTEFTNAVENINKANKTKSLNSENSSIEKIFPFTTFFKNNHYKEETLFTGLFEDDLKLSKLLMKYIDNIFTEIKECHAFELLRNNNERGNYLLTKQAKVIAMTCTYAALKRRDFIKLGLEYDNILMEESAQILEIETFVPLLMQKSKNDDSRLKRVILIGDNNQLPPIVKNNAFKIYSKMDQSMFTRFIRLQIPSVNLNYQGRTRSSIVELYRWRYKELHDLPCVIADKSNPNSLFNYTNPGFKFDYQFINVPDYLGTGETSPFPFYYQNLAEAEYVVATYMFMCIAGYNPKNITILTTYNGQKYLIKDIIQQKCSWHPLFQTPHKITTVDKYQGQQNDYILLSLVRSKHIGHIRDIRRLVVAMSRAKLGLYVFGRFDVYQNCFELSKTMKLFGERGMDLEIGINERFPGKRAIEKVGGYIKVQNFMHMYKIVQELLKIIQSQQKIFSSNEIMKLSSVKDLTEGEGDTSHEKNDVEMHM